MTAAITGAAALEPVRAHLRQAAAAQAAQIRADAHHCAGRIRQQARLAAAATVEQARADGRAEAAPLAAAELRRQVRAAVAALPGKPGYDHLAGRIAALARRAAGPGAVVTAVPAGGWLAQAPGVTVDCSLTRLADLAVEALGAEVQGLWTP